jgi:hypothetical protein
LSIEHAGHVNAAAVLPRIAAVAILPRKDIARIIRKEIALSPRLATELATAIVDRK